MRRRERGQQHDLPEWNSDLNDLHAFDFNAFIDIDFLAMLKFKRNLTSYADRSLL